MEYKDKQLAGAASAVVLGWLVKAMGDKRVIVTAQVCSGN